MSYRDTLIEMIQSEYDENAANRKDWESALNFVYGKTVTPAHMVDEALSVVMALDESHGEVTYRDLVEATLAVFEKRG